VRFPALSFPVDLSPLQGLNTPKSAYHAIRPLSIINALSSPPPPSLYPTSAPIRSAHSLFSSREHQDAQELFQLVSECIKNEMMAVDREGLRDRGMAGVLDFSVSSSWGPTSVPSLDSAKDLKDDTERAVHNSKSVFDGLTANRRSCVVCGYTEAVMHFGFDNWQLSVPRLAVRLVHFDPLTVADESIDVMSFGRLLGGVYTIGDPQGLYLSEMFRPGNSPKTAARNRNPRRSSRHNPILFNGLLKLCCAFFLPISYAIFFAIQEQTI